MKKVLSILAISVLLVAMLTACGSNGTETKDVSKGAEQVDTSTVAIGAVVLARDDIPSDVIYSFVKTI